MSEQSPSPFPEKKISPKTVEDILSCIDAKDPDAPAKLTQMLQSLSEENFDLVWSAVEDKLASAQFAYQHEFFLQSASEVVGKHWSVPRSSKDLGVTWSAENHERSAEKQELEIHNKETDERYPLSQLLPPGFRFKEDFSYFCDHSDKTIHFRVHDMYTKGFLLKVLHEIGHAHQAVESRDLALHPREWLQVMGSIYKNRLFRNNIADDVETVVKEAWPFGETKLTHEDLPAWYLERAAKRDIALERNAWAFALHNARQLKKQGFDVVGDFTSYSDIRGLIEYALLSYDELLANNRSRRALKTEYKTAPAFTHTAARGFKGKRVNQ